MEAGFRCSLRRYSFARRGTLKLYLRPVAHSAFAPAMAGPCEQFVNTLANLFITLAGDPLGFGYDESAAFALS
jgi:hypothetical protein